MNESEVDVRFGRSPDGRGVVIFLDEKTPPEKMKEFIKTCEGIINVETVNTPLGIGVAGKNPQILYYEIGEFMADGCVERISKPVEIL
ncbi:MAG: hypothetical protein WCV70_00700 [Patescibacteria group bacterium]|jgi:hypothetical protein